jgi:glycosyltransferase involved in cell wall biosynthesis
MTSEPMVSVVIPTHNRAHMVGEAIDSVLRQTLTGVEIIVVDDGSTDDTDACIRAYGDRVRYVKTHHGGVAHARNVGMRSARGRYLTFLDSDDLLYPYALELQAQLLDRHPAVALVCAEMSGFDNHGWSERYHLKTYHRSAYRDPALTYDKIFDRSMPLAAAVEPPAALLGDDPDAAGRRAYFGNVFDTYLLHLVLCQNTVMFRRSVVSEVGERNVAVRHWQEVDYLLRITRRHKVCFVDVPTYQLRHHEGQISSTAGDRGKYVWTRKQQILLRVVKRHAMADPAYYRKHRRRINAQLAHLHRAVAVPMLLLDSEAGACRRWAARAQRYLDRCAHYGHPARGLRLAAHAPAPLRRLAVALVEWSRRFYWSVRYASLPVTAIIHDPVAFIAEHVA